MSLADLESKYLQVTATAPAIYRGNTEVKPLVDGRDYFQAIYDSINTTGSNADKIFIVGWLFMPAMDLTTGKVSGTNSIGSILAQKAALGVDVRIILNGTPRLYWVQQLQWRANLEDAEKLRNWGGNSTTAPPLAGRVLYDWSGANLTGSHHQKAIFVKSGTNLVAFLGGMDIVTNRWSFPPMITNYGSR